MERSNKDNPESRSLKWNVHFCSFHDDITCQCADPAKYDLMDFRAKEVYERNASMGVGLITALCLNRQLLETHPDDNPSSGTKQHCRLEDIPNSQLCGSGPWELNSLSQILKNDIRYFLIEISIVPPLNALLAWYDLTILSHIDCNRWYKLLICEWKAQ